MIIQKTIALQVKTSYKVDTTHSRKPPYMLPSYTLILLKLWLDLGAMCKLRLVFVFIGKFLFILTNEKWYSHFHLILSSSLCGFLN